MYTLGHDFMPPGIHAGGLRYHGESPLVSQLYAAGLIEARSLMQTACFEGALLFAKNEGIVPAPEIPNVPGSPFGKSTGYSGQDLLQV